MGRVRTGSDLRKDKDGERGVFNYFLVVQETESLKVEILEQKEAPRAGFELGGVVCERVGPHLRMAAAVKRGYRYAQSS